MTITFGLLPVDNLTLKKIILIVLVQMNICPALIPEKLRLFLYPVVQRQRNGRVLTSDDGLTSSGVLPNNDETFQKRESVEILKSDLSKFTCVCVSENPPEEHGPGAPIAGVVAGVVVVVALVAVAVGLILYLSKSSVLLCVITVEWS
uniref:Immunoglobulin C1-set domain-containing protein n=1 Tax=Pundamilia nyererei TaxID=303518 RepID=A0A3B4H8V5_9CICH